MFITQLQGEAFKGIMFKKTTNNLKMLSKCIDLVKPLDMDQWWEAYVIYIKLYVETLVTSIIKKHDDLVTEQLVYR